MRKREASSWFPAATFVAVLLLSGCVGPGSGPVVPQSIPDGTVSNFSASDPASPAHAPDSTTEASQASSVAPTRTTNRRTAPPSGDSPSPSPESPPSGPTATPSASETPSPTPPDDGPFDGISVASTAPTSVTVHWSLNRYGPPYEGPDNETLDPALSADGRFLVFTSSASNLVSGDTNGHPDVFVRDLDAGTIERVSIATNGTQTNEASGSATISQDGRFVAFDSRATNLALNDTNKRPDVFLHDRQSHETRPLSRAANGTLGNGASIRPRITPDGRYVAFSSTSDNLVPDDPNRLWDVLVYDLSNSELTLESRSSAGEPANGYSWRPSVSGDGRYLAFSSAASNLVAGDTNAKEDVFLRDRTLGTTVLVSRGVGGALSDGPSTGPVISLDGQSVAFTSFATNMVPEDRNGFSDVFLFNAGSSSLRRVSLGPGGVEPNGHSSEPVVDGTGRRVAFRSMATNLLPGAATYHVYVVDLVSDTLRAESRSANGTLGSDRSGQPALDMQGRRLAFVSASSNLDPSGGVYPSAFVRELNGSSTCRESIPAPSVLRSRILWGSNESSLDRSGPWLGGQGHHSYPVDLEPGKSYYYQLQAVNGAGEEARSLVRPLSAPG